MQAKAYVSFKCWNAYKCVNNLTFREIRGFIYNLFGKYNLVFD